MQPLISKASVHLTASSLPRCVSSGDAVSLRMRDDGTIAAIVSIPSRLPFGFGRSREFMAGTLGQQATNLLRPAIEKAMHLRVRVVEVEPAHLSGTGHRRLFLSVWGDPVSVMSDTSRYSIFSRRRIKNPQA